MHGYAHGQVAPFSCHLVPRCYIIQKPNCLYNEVMLNKIEVLYYKCQFHSSFSSTLP